MVKTNFEKWEQLLLGLVTSSPASPGGPNEETSEDTIPPTIPVPTRPILPDTERIKLDDLPDYLEKHHLRVTGGNPNTWPPTIYTEPMEE
jgi:hypothetical protein